ncbi:hypothetical protein C0075_06540 [Rhizobium sp. KAs_5_22]|uniref:hypothetical protein n=1 Tax=Ciceribacter selenitireducens TaxID=448181 RepID=UPI00048E3EF1|nr:hypothetical protein [Ciceribacter selenitireducens]PPJ45412.1 hypothetical protein C0075_06540 [Rhizobium sp. KAs_5_22]
MQMADPILNAIQSAIIGISLSDPATGAMLGRLKLQPSTDIRTALKVDDGVLRYSAEHVRSLTMAELNEALANSVRP